MDTTQEAIITIDGTEYKASDLSDEAKAQLLSIQVTDGKLAELNAEIAITQTARAAYAKAFSKLLPKAEN